MAIKKVTPRPPRAGARTIEQLRGNPLFAGLEPAVLADLAVAARPCRAKRDGFFFLEDQPATTLYVLVSGWVKLTQVTPQGREIILRFVGPGQLFGAIGSLNHTPYPASAQVVEDALALTWQIDTLRAFAERTPRLALNMLEILAGRMQHLQDRYRQLATQRVEPRLAHSLLRLADQAGRQLPGGILLDIRLSREDLAKMNGTTLYTASRILSRWEQEGLVKSRRERVLIRDLQGLAAVAEKLLDDRSAG
jgi:CRP-like cAMP-binding protein